MVILYHLKQNCQTRAVDLFFDHLIILLDLPESQKKSDAPRIRD